MSVNSVNADGSLTKIAGNVGGSSNVADVKVNGTSVVNPNTKEANIDLSGYAETSDIPTDLADLSDDSTHRLVTDTEKSTWDNKADVSDIPTVNNPTITIQKNGQNVDTFTLNQTTNKVINISVPTKTSDLQNDSSFITNTVNNLANYYLKTQTYTQSEVDALIDAAINGRFHKVNTLPTTGEPNIIYLVPKATPETSDACDEYIWQDNAWELIGSTNIDLSGYVTDDELNTALADYLTTSAFNTAIANYYTKTEIGNLLTNKVDKVTGKGLSTNDYDNTAKGIVDAVTSNLANKVDKVTGKGLSTNDYTDTEKSKNKTAYDHSQDSSRVTTATASGFYKIASTSEGHIAGLTAVQKSDITALGIPAQDTTYGVVDKTANGLCPVLPNETTTTKYLRQDGSWQVPPNTTYSVATGDGNGQIKVTPSSGSAYNVGVKGLGSAAYANLANTVMEVGKTSSRSTAIVGTWTAMCNSSQTGSPTLPTAGKWWNVMSLNNWSDSSTNWVSQLAVATQDTLSGVWWRANNAAGTSIDSSTWHRLAEGDSSGNANNALKINNISLSLVN